MDIYIWDPCGHLYLRPLWTFIFEISVDIYIWDLCGHLYLRPLWTSIFSDETKIYFIRNKDILWTIFKLHYTLTITFMREWALLASYVIWGICYSDRSPQCNRITATGQDTDNKIITHLSSSRSIHCTMNLLFRLHCVHTFCYNESIRLSVIHYSIAKASTLETAEAPSAQMCWSGQSHRCS